MSGLSIKRNAVMINMACNDPDNGNFAGHVEMIQIGSDFIELEACRNAPRFDDTGAKKAGYVRLAGKSWLSIGAKYGVGNWCWNGYWFEIPVAVEFLIWLHGRKLFDLSCGETRIFNMWRNSVSLNNKDDRDFLSRMLGKPSTFDSCDHNDFPRKRAVA